MRAASFMASAWMRGTMKPGVRGAHHRHLADALEQRLDLRRDGRVGCLPGEISTSGIR